MSARILVFDVETSPHILWNFGNRMEWMRPAQVIEPSRMICFGAQWLGEHKVTFASEWDDGPRKMAEKLFALIDEADIVVAYNGDRFDNKKINTLFESQGLGRPSPFKSVDPFKTMKKHFDLQSYKLDEVLKFFGLPQKVTTTQQLWVDLLLEGTQWDTGNADRAKKLMRKYQIQDVRALEELYHHLGPWLPPMPGFVHGDGKCDNCGSDNLQLRGYSLTLRGKYQRYQCNDCKRWGKFAKAEGNTENVGLA